MKNAKHISLFAFCGLLGLEPLVAQDSHSISGALVAGASWTTIESNISTLSDKSYIESYNARNKNHNLSAGAMADLNWQYGNNHFLLEGYSSRDIGGLSIGYGRDYGAHNTTLRLISSISDTSYNNPYAIGDRDEIRTQKLGAKITQTYHLNEHQNFFASYLIADNHYKGETTPRELRREGKLHQVEIGMDLSLIEMKFFTDYNDAQGGAESFQRYGITTGGMVPIPYDLILTLEIEFAKQYAKHANPIFGTKQNATLIKSSLGFIKANLLNNPSLFAVAKYEFESHNNAISFLDEKLHSIGIGVGYKF